MKNGKTKVLLSLVCMVMAVMLLPAAFAEDIPINEINFPDSMFRSIMVARYGDSISLDEIANTRMLFLEKNGIKDFTGIGYFTALEDFQCYGNGLTSLDVSKNTALKRLDCCSNKLTALNVSKNTALTELLCYNNKLTALDVTKNTALTKLSCFSNSLTSLNTSKNTALEKLSCKENSLTKLDVSKNTALKYLYCYKNKLTALDVAKNTVLLDLDVHDNKLAVLDVSKNTLLKELNCYSNSLTALDVTNNPSLNTLYCADNSIAALDISKNTALEKLTCNKNNLTALDISNNSALTYLKCSYNFIADTSALEAWLATGGHEGEILPQNTAATYTLTVNLNGGNGSTVGGSYMEGSVIPVDAGTKDGFNFGGWKSSNGGSFEDASKAATNFTMPAKDTTITANWASVPHPDAGLILADHLTLGAGKKLSAVNLLPPGISAGVSWTSENSAVVNAVKKGSKYTLIAVSEGVTNVTATSADGRTATIPVTVVPAASAVSGISGLSALKLMRGESKLLAPVITPAAASDKSVFWASTDKNIATVEDGKVVGKSAGKCQIIALTSSGIRKAVKVKVDKFAAVESVSLEPAEITLKKGETFTLTATVNPADANQKLVWSTAGKKIATVKNGLVTTKKAGTTVITCKFSNGEKLTCNVTVTE